MKFSNGMLAVGSMVIFGVQALASPLVTCEVKKGGNLSAAVPIEPWKGSSSDVGSHMTDIYHIGEKYYAFALPFSNDLSQASLLVGHSSGGGVAFDYSFNSDLISSDLKVIDINVDIEIDCKKN